MKKYFLPKSFPLTKKTITKLVKKFKLTQSNMVEINHWNQEDSPYGGTVIETNGEKSSCSCQKGNSVQFLKENPDGKILELVLN